MSRFINLFNKFYFITLNIPCPKAVLRRRLTWAAGRYSTQKRLPLVCALSPVSRYLYKDLVGHLCGFICLSFCESFPGISDRGFWHRLGICFPDGRFRRKTVCLFLYLSAADAASCRKSRCACFQYQKSGCPGFVLQKGSDAAA